MARYAICVLFMALLAISGLPAAVQAQEQALSEATAATVEGQQVGTAGDDNLLLAATSIFADAPAYMTAAAAGPETLDLESGEENAAAASDGSEGGEEVLQAVGTEGDGNAAAPAASSTTTAAAKEGAAAATATKGAPAGQAVPGLDGKVYKGATTSASATAQATTGPVQGAVSDTALFEATARNTAAAVADAALRPGETNWGTGPRGLELLPVVWTEAPAPGGGCAPGFYLDGTATCRRCAQGFVRPAGQAACAICLPGTFADVELQECRPCAKGNYAHWHAMTRCLWCRPGSYSDELGATKCKACPAGTKSGFQAEQCI